MGADMTVAICAWHVDRHVAEARIRTLSNDVIGAAYNYGEEIDYDDDAYIELTVDTHGECDQTVITYGAGKPAYIYNVSMSIGD